MRYHYVNIDRRKLPALERAGADARVIRGEELFVATFKETRILWETMAGVTAPVPSRVSEVATGLPGTVVAATCHGDGLVALVDLIVHQGRKYQARPWEAREAALGAIWEQLGTRLGAVNMEGRVQRAFMRAFDEAVSDGLLGLIVRKPGDTRNYICSLEG